jgi:tetratricopeptide (TPR) repeat protein
MTPVPSADPAARDRQDQNAPSVHDHAFAAANTAVPHMLGLPAKANAQRFDMLRRAVRVDIFGLREGEDMQGRLHAPLRPQLPTLQPGRQYVLEVVVRTLGIGHELTQGTADSNELWLDLEVRARERLIGRSGAIGGQGEVDPWAYFLNAYLLDRAGDRIERRNAQDIFVALYNNQIPPGAAAVIHYGITIPADAHGPIRLDVALRYRKFDTRFYRHVMGERFAGNDLPIATLATDRVAFPLADEVPVEVASRGIDDWERWNDYGIGLLRQGKRGESRQAEEAFAKVEKLGHAQGALNLARVLYREGRLDEAAAALTRASKQQPPAPPWTIAWYAALVERERGNLDQAILALEGLAATKFREARARGFDFGRDYRMISELGRTLYERARQERGEQRLQTRLALLRRARDRLEQALSLEPEYAASHYNLSLIFTELGLADQAARHRDLHEKYRTDDNAVEQAVTLHRSRNSAADHAAEPTAIYDLQRPGSATGTAAADPEETSARKGALARR